MQPESDEWGPGELVGEHRLLRRLGRGARAEVWLAAPALVEDGARIALKLPAPGTAPGVLLAEAEALSRARGRHAVRLQATLPIAPGRTALALEHVPHGLDEVVTASGGERMRAGAAVTVLAPIAAELHRLQGLGIVHGGVRLGAIGLRGSGEPVLLAFGSARIARGAELDAAAAADARAFLAVATVVASMAASETPGWADFRRWLETVEPRDGGWLVEFGRRAFEAAEPEPVALPRYDPLRVSLGDPAADAPDESRPPASSEAARRVLLEGGALGRLRGMLAWSRPGGARTLGGIRPRVWVPIAIVGAGLIAVAVALPSGDGATAAPIGSASATGEAVPEIGPSQSGVAPDGGDAAGGPGAPDASAPPDDATDGSAAMNAPGASSADGAATAAPGASIGASTGGAGAGATSGVVGETSRAAIGLLASRARCYTQLSIGCLGGVDEPGSDAEAEDRDAIRALVDGTGALPPAFLAVGATEYQRLGDAAIVDASDASGATMRLLLMLTPDGWRIRTYL